jgi:hypothetical protein
MLTTPKVEPRTPRSPGPRKVARQDVTSAYIFVPAHAHDWTFRAQVHCKALARRKGHSSKLQDNGSESLRRFWKPASLPVCPIALAARSLAMLVDESWRDVAWCAAWRAARRGKSDCAPHETSDVRLRAATATLVAAGWQRDYSRTAAGWQHDRSTITATAHTVPSMQSAAGMADRHRQVQTQAQVSTRQSGPPETHCCCVVAHSESAIHPTQR